MSYAQNGLIEATDFNNLVGAAVETGADKLNTTWSTGGTTAVSYTHLTLPTILLV